MASTQSTTPMAQTRFTTLHVVGVGGVGFWLSTALMKALPPSQIHLWDDDTMQGGTGWQRLPMAGNSTLKVALVRGFSVAAIGNENAAEVVLHPRRFTGHTSNISGGRKGWLKHSLVIDCSDMAPVVRNAVWKNARRNGAQMLRVSYDGKGSTMTFSTGLPLIDAPDGGYNERPTLGLSFAAGGMGAEVVRRYIANELPERLDIQMQLLAFVHDESYPVPNHEEEQ